MGLGWEFSRMRRTRCFGLRIALLFLVTTTSSQAFVRTMTGEGFAVRWSGNPHYNLAGNPTNRSGITPGYLYSSVVKGLQRWQEASNQTINFDYWQGTDGATFEANSDYNGLSSIYFASNSGS